VDGKESSVGWKGARCSSCDSIVEELFKVINSSSNKSSLDEAIDGAGSSSYKIVVNEATNARSLWNKCCTRSRWLASKDEVSNYPRPTLIGLILC